jgi:Holliday junction resolvasome RuvABC endonuclease subunit
MTRVVGLDLSLSATGIAWWIDGSVGCEQVGRAGVTKLDLVRRIGAVDKVVQQVLNGAGLADLYVVEAPTFGGHTVATAGRVELNAMWWLVVRRLIRAEQHVALVTPTQLKLYGAGKGNAPKNVVVDAVARRLPMFPTTGNDNTADAAVLCAMGCDHLGQPIAAMPAAHRVALNKVAWPEIGAVTA